MGMTIGEKIKERRIQLDMTQEELAKKTGYKSRSSINKIELSRDMPLKKAQVFAKVLDLPLSYLMGWDNIEWNPQSQDIIVNEPENTILEKYQETIGNKNLLKYFDFLSAFTSLSEKDQQMIADMVNRLSNKN